MVAIGLYSLLIHLRRCNRKVLDRIDGCKKKLAAPKAISIPIFNLLGSDFKLTHYPEGSLVPTICSFFICLPPVQVSSCHFS